MAVLNQIGSKSENMVLLHLQHRLNMQTSEKL